MNITSGIIEVSNTSYQPNEPVMLSITSYCMTFMVNFSSTGILVYAVPRMLCARGRVLRGAVFQMVVFGWE